MATKTIKVSAEPGKQEILITREFDAPRELVFNNGKCGVPGFSYGEEASPNALSYPASFCLLSST